MKKFLKIIALAAFSSREDCEAVCQNCYFDPAVRTWTCIGESPGRVRNPIIGKFGQGEGAEVLGEIIAVLLKTAFNVAGLLLLAVIILGGLSWMLAGGNKEAMVKARGRLEAGVVGFAIFMCLFAIINFITPALGLDIFDPLRIVWPTP